MGYRVTAVDSMRNRYSELPGLEGPFDFSGRVLYYDPREGSYWDPRTDFYVSQNEMDQIHQRLYDILKR